MTYRILDKFLHNDEGWEVRKYNPHKRTVYIGSKDYFLQFPWVVFMYLKSKDKSYLAVAFAKEDDSLVYKPILPHCSIDDQPNLWLVCLGRGLREDDGEFRHYCHPTSVTFDAMIERFWTSRFDSYDYWYYNRDAVRDAFGNVNPIHRWQRSSLNQVLGALKGTIRLEEFILNTMLAISDYRTQR